jgi:DNA polymerase I-like protein with 3'-5' exonuclease and polymerase domains
VKQFESYHGDEAGWAYNCLDCTYTRECGEVEQANLVAMGLVAVDEFQQKMFYPILDAMIRGVKVDSKVRDAFAGELMEEMAAREEYFRFVLGHPLNPRSAPQMQKLFYEDLQQRPIRKRGKGGVQGNLTLDDKALTTIGEREPLLRPLLRKIAEFRSLGVFLSTFVMAPLDVDGRMRCSYNICGTESFRLSSSENAFGSGTNLQNVPAGGEDDDSELVLPNVRKIFVPDPGFTMFDADLSKADLRIVVEEADESELRTMLREGRDPYVEVAREFYRDPSITKTRSDGSPHPKYKVFKSFCHGSHYVGTAAGLAQRLGLTVHESEKTQKWYFSKYPAIPKWHTRVRAQLAAKHYVENAFGNRRYYFDRIDEALLRQAIAWIPQSTVALYINRIWLNLWENYKHIWILLQVHDSLVGQFPTYRKSACLADLARAAASVVIPYPNPLVIPVGIKTSEVSWGHCE